MTKEPLSVRKVTMKNLTEVERLVLDSLKVDMAGCRNNDEVLCLLVYAKMSGMSPKWFSVNLKNLGAKKYPKFSTIIRVRRKIQNENPRMYLPDAKVLRARHTAEGVYEEYSVGGSTQKLR